MTMPAADLLQHLHWDIPSGKTMVVCGDIREKYGRALDRALAACGIPLRYFPPKVQEQARARARRLSPAFAKGGA